MIDNDDYKQLSDDWRHRDQLTWQLPSVLVAVSGALIAAIFNFDKFPAGMKDYLLWGGLLFAGLLTIALGQNIYFQTVAEDLMDAIKNDERVRGSSIPRRRENGPSFGEIMGRCCFVKAGSTGLFLLSATFTGFLGFLISNGQFHSETKFEWWIGTGIIVVGLTILLNLKTYRCEKQLPDPPKKAKDNQ